MFGKTYGHFNPPYTKHLLTTVVLFPPFLLFFFSSNFCGYFSFSVQRQHVIFPPFVKVFWVRRKFSSSDIENFTPACRNTVLCVRTFSLHYFFFIGFLLETSLACNFCNKPLRILRSSFNESTVKVKFCFD